MLYDLVFEGGGARGMAFVGALHEFERRRHTPGRLLGTSAGAIVATLLAAGYSAAELQGALSEEVEGKSVFARFLGEPPPFSKEEVQESTIRALVRALDFGLLPDAISTRVDDALVQAMLRVPAHRNVYALIERGGWYAAHEFEAWLRTRLSSGTHAGAPRRYGAMTLAEFHAATRVWLSMVVADTTDWRMRVLNARTAPHCPLVQAVRMSMNLPFVWPDVVWQESWGGYRGRSLAGHVIVDGGLVSGFPLELFVSDAPSTQELMGARGSAALLGLLIDEQLPVPGAPPLTPPPQAFNFSSVRAVQRVARLVGTMTSARDRMVIDAFADLVVHLPGRDYGTIEFNMPARKRELLLKAGSEAMRAWFERTAPSDVAAPFDAAGRAAYANRAARAMLEP